MNINSYADLCWEVHEKTETNVKKWPFRTPRRD